MKAARHTVFQYALVLVFFTGTLNAQSVSEDIDHLYTISEASRSPHRITSDAEGLIYLSDASDKVIYKCDNSGTVLDTIRSVAFPISVAVNNEGQLFIGDAETGCIYKYDGVSAVSKFYTGTLYPTSMVFGPDNTLYISDSKLQKAIALDISGNVIREYGEGMLKFPTGIAYDHTNDRILVGEHGGSGSFKPTVKVYMFNSDATLYKSFGSNGSDDGQFYRIQGITIGKCGNIYVVDPFQGRISIFSSEGTFITKFGDYGLEAGEMNVPMDIVFDVNQQILVSSMNNGKLEVFSVNDTLPCSYIKTERKMICTGETANIEMEFSGTAPWTCTYTKDGLNPTVINTSENPYILTVSEPGFYEVTALSDANYDGTCFTGSAEVMVSAEMPTATISGDASICEGEFAEVSVELTGSAPWDITYTKDGKNPLTISTVNNPHKIPVSASGLYELSGLSGGGCAGNSFTGSANIVVNQLPEANITEGDERLDICEGESIGLTVELSGTAPWSFIYTKDEINHDTIRDITESTVIIPVSDPGAYEIIKVNDQNCASSNSTGYPEVITTEAPSSSIITEDISICSGETTLIPVYFTGMPPWTLVYKFNNESTRTVREIYNNTHTIRATQQGTYEVIGISDLNCKGSVMTGTTTVTVCEQALPEFSYSADNLEVIFVNSSMYADGYEWNFGDGTGSNETEPTHIFPADGEYIVSLTANNTECGSVVFIDTITVNTVSAGSIEMDNKLKVYPNPSNGLITVEFVDLIKQEVRIDIINHAGIMVFSSRLPTGEKHNQIDLTHLTNGLYIIRVKIDGIIKHDKLIIAN